MSELVQSVFNIYEIGKNCLGNSTALEILAAEKDIIASLKREENEKGGE